MQRNLFDQRESRPSRVGNILRAAVPLIGGLLLLNNASAPSGCNRPSSYGMTNPVGTQMIIGVPVAIGERKSDQGEVLEAYVGVRLEDDPRTILLVSTNRSFGNRPDNGFVQGARTIFRCAFEKGTNIAAFGERDNFGDAMKAKKVTGCNTTIEE